MLMRLALALKAVAADGVPGKTATVGAITVYVCVCRHTPIPLDGARSKFLSSAPKLRGFGFRLWRGRKGNIGATSL